jgi:asparagine synthase (glutamine-hydrolysing)
MQTDYFMYLPGDILTKVDRATMSASLEGREPLLDYQLAELAFRMPVDWKISSKQRKRVLKDLAFEYLPRDLLDRPKKGFSVPYFRWLKGDLKYLLDEHLSKNALLKLGILCPSTVGKIVTRFLEGDPRVNVTIWNLLMFQMWCKRWL